MNTPLIKTIPPVRAISFRLDVNSSVSQLQKAIGGYVRTYEADAVTDTDIRIDPGEDFGIVEPLTAIQICTNYPILFSGTVRGETVEMVIRRMFVSDEQWDSVVLSNPDEEESARVFIAYGVRMP